MTKFVRDNFIKHAGWVHYVIGDRMTSTDRRFVARFKYNKRDTAGFISFLIKHFTVEEYFTALEETQKTNEGGPSTILEAKGYIPKTVKIQLDKKCLPHTKEGVNRLIQLHKTQLVKV